MASAFKQYYRSTYGNSKIDFDTTSIDGIIEGNCLATNISQRKVLVLYCHNEIDEFGQTICEDWFTDEDIESLLVYSKFLVTGYNVTTEIRRNELLQEISTTLTDNELFSSIQSGESKIYIFVPYSNIILCQAYIDDSFTKEAFLEELLSIKTLHINITQTLKEEKETADETQTCKTFQQIMFDQLGNKDFDVFFKDQHMLLKEKIGFAYFGPPSSENGYQEKQKKFIGKAYEAIIAQSDKYASGEGMVIISIIYVCCVNFNILMFGDEEAANIKYEEFNPVPIFILRKCHSGDKPRGSRNGEYCRVVIDNTLRVYKSWQNFLNENKYRKCVLCAPRNGEYSCDDDGGVKLDFHFTPACEIGHKVLKGLDITSAIAGIGSGGVLAVAAIPAVTFIAPVVITGAIIAGVGTGIYAIGRSIANLVDRSTHEEALSFSDAEARAAYINIVAGSLGFVGAGATAVLAKMARGGTDIGKGVILTVNTLAGANLAAGGIAIGNSVYDVSRGYFVDGEKPSPLVLVQLGASALFFGNAVYSFRTATAIVSEAHSNTIQEIRDSLRSNRHRRTFTKFQKETIRVNNGDTASGNAKVISTIRSDPNTAETMAILTRNNKRFNELGIKFSAADGKVALNGQTVDIKSFSAAVNKVQISEIMAIPQNKITTMSSKSPFNIPWTEVAKVFVTTLQSRSSQQIIVKLLNLFRPYIQRKLLELVRRVFNPNNSASKNIGNHLNKLGVRTNELSLIVDFVCDKARKCLKLGRMERGCIYVVQLLVNHYLCGRDISDELVNECLNYASTLMIQKEMEIERTYQERQRIRGIRRLKDCNICIGYYNYHTT